MRKDPTLACILNLLLAGTGHMYLGQLRKGLLILAMGIVLAAFIGVIGAVPWIIWSMINAYITARKINQSAVETMAESVK